MKKILLMLMVLVSVVLLVGCNASDTVKHNIGKDADNFNTYRKVSVINLRSDKILMEVEGYISIKDSTEKELAVIKIAPKEYKMHYIYLASEVVYLVEQLENTSTDQYHWKISIYAVKPEIIGGE